MDNHLMGTYLDAIQSGKTRWKYDCAEQTNTDMDSTPIQTIPAQSPLQESSSFDSGQQEEEPFSIIGSWISTGSDGFGQAQPGSEVWFDGTHCCFFSPYDTYEFYQQDGQWILDCTSAIFGETLSFDVVVNDQDHITIL